MINWFNSKGYYQGIFWIMLVCLTSSLNDAFMKLLGERLDGMQIAFCRFSLAAILLFPILIYKGKSSFVTSNFKLHVIRALLGFGAVVSWCYSLKYVPLAVASTIALTVPLFVLPLAKIFLNETIGRARLIATLLGFIGILIILLGGNDTIVLNIGFETGCIMLVSGAVLFAISDILNKVMIEYESSISMLFYFALGTSIAGFVPAYMVWINPTIKEFILLICLGAGGNLILFFILKAFSSTEVSALAPFRYLELIFAGIFGYIFWGEIPYINNWVGASIIIPSTLFVAYYDARRSKKKSEDNISTCQPSDLSPDHI